MPAIPIENYEAPAEPTVDINTIDNQLIENEMTEQTETESTFDVGSVLDASNNIPSSSHIQYNVSQEEFVGATNNEQVPQQITPSGPKEFKSSSAFGIFAGLAGAAAGVAGAVGVAKKAAEAEDKKDHERDENRGEDNKWIIE